MRYSARTAMFWLTLGLAIALAATIAMEVTL